MKDTFPTDSTIRQYLLGRLGDQEQLETSLSKQICLDDELAEMVEAIEEEIIEDYLDENLSLADKQAVEEYFLRPPERQEKLRFVRALRHRLETENAVVAAKGPADTRLGADQRVIYAGTNAGVIAHLRSHFRAYSECAALVFVAVSLIYMFRINQRLQSQIELSHKDQSRLERELAQEREHSADLLAKLEPPVATLPLFVGTYRGPDTHQVEIRPYTQRIRIEIGDAYASAYDVRVETRGKTPIWSQAGLKSSSGGLRFEVPVQGITTGDYQIVITALPQHTASPPYGFHVKAAK